MLLVHGPHFEWIYKTLWWTALRSSFLQWGVGSALSSYIKGFQPLGHGLVLVSGLLETGLHGRWVVGEWVTLRLYWQPLPWLALPPEPCLEMLALSVCVCVCESLGPVWPFVTPWVKPTRLLCSWDFPGKKICFLLQGILPTQEDQIWVSCIAGRFFTLWVPREAPFPYVHPLILAVTSPEVWPGIVLTAVKQCSGGLKSSFQNAVFMLETKQSHK